MRYFLLLSLLILCNACSTSKVILAPIDDSLPAEAYFLPIALETDITREHIAAVQRTMLAALRNRGFLISESATISESLPRVLLTVEQFRRDTILAGHVNSIRGRLKVFAADNTLLAESTHTESERGGLLFSSGQVLKGLGSGIDNFGESAFDDWLERFAKRLASTLPKPDSKGAARRIVTPTISNITVSNQNDFTQVCMQGTPANDAAVILPQAQFPMREIQSAGKYCVILPTSLLASSNLNSATVTLESPYGVRSSAALPLQSVAARCEDLQVIGNTNPDAIHFRVTCGDTRSLCPESSPCKEYTFRLYEAQTNGAFTLVDEFVLPGSKHTRSRSEAPDEIRYRVFQLHRTDNFLKPVPLLFQSPTGAE